MNQVTVSRLRDMRLPTMSAKLQEMLSTPSLQGLSWPDAIDILVDAEHNGRADKRLAHMLRCDAKRVSGVLIVLPQSVAGIRLRYRDGLVG